MRTLPPFRLAAVTLVVAAALTACGTTVSPWQAHDTTAGMKARASDPGAVCPVVFSNGTDGLIEAGYLTLGVESSVGLIPSGQSVEVRVSCRDERIEAFAVADQGVMAGVVRYRKLARLDLVRPTRLAITAADRVR